MKTCVKCDVEKPLVDFYLYKGRPNGYCKSCAITYSRERYHRNPEATRKWRRENPDKITASRLKYRHSPKAKRLRQSRYAQRRSAILDFLGGRCCQCEFDDRRALQIDHVNGGGVQELRATATDKYYELIRANPKNYQILCANCNWIKRHTNDENPWLAETQTKLAIAPR